MKTALPTLPSSPVLFIHMYKAAGTTIEYILQSYYHVKEVFPGYHNRDYLGISKDELRKYRLFMGHVDYQVVDVLPESTILATLLRDPVSLSVSLFNHLRTRPDHPRYSDLESKNMSFEDFMTDQCTLPLIQNLQTLQIVGKRSYAKILAEEQDEEAARSRYLSIAKERLKAFDFVGVTERLEESIILLCHVLGIPRPPYVPHLNVSERKRVRVSELSDEAKALTREVNDLDVELHAFASTLFDGQFQAVLGGAASGRNGFADVAPIDEASIDLSGPMNGIGWWPIGKGEETVRRTGPGKVSTIGLPLTADEDLRLTIKARSAFSRNIEDIRIRVNGEVVRPEVTSCEDGSFLVHVDVRKECIREGRNLTEVEIEVGQVAAPCTLDSGFNDIRAIGLSVFGLEISPL